MVSQFDSLVRKPANLIVNNTLAPKQDSLKSLNNGQKKGFECEYQGETIFDYLSKKDFGLEQEEEKKKMLEFEESMKLGVKPPKRPTSNKRETYQKIRNTAKKPIKIADLGIDSDQEQELSGDFQEISSQIKNLLGSKFTKTENLEDIKQENVKKEQDFEQECILNMVVYNPKKYSEKDPDLVHSLTCKLQGFQKWADWVPMPYPYRELMLARRMYLRGDTLMVQTPDFVDFANDLKNFTSRNKLIFRMKRMMLERGFRSVLQMSYSGEMKNLSLIVNCCRSGKANCKNISIKNQCPFAMYFQRRSTMIEDQKGIKSPKKENIKVGDLGEVADEEEEEQSFLFKDQLEMRKKPGRPPDANKFSRMLEDIDIPEDPFYLVRYRSFHNHDLCTNTIEYHNLVIDSDIHRKGAVKLLPQGQVAIQDLSCVRRKEMVEEEIYEKMPIQFEQVGKTTTIYKQLGRQEQDAQIRIIEPQGMLPSLIYVDMTQYDDTEFVKNKWDPEEYDQKMQEEQEANWPPSQEMIQQTREVIIKCYRITLDLVGSRISTGEYSLEKYRRIHLLNNKRNNSLKTEQVEKGENPIKRRKLNAKGDSLEYIVNQFTKDGGHKSKKKNGEDLVHSEDEEQDEEENLTLKNDEEETTYNIYQ